MIAQIDPHYTGRPVFGSKRKVFSLVPKWPDLAYRLGDIGEVVWRMRNHMTTVSLRMDFPAWVIYHDLTRAFDLRSQSTLVFEHWQQCRLYQLYPEDELPRFELFGPGDEEFCRIALTERSDLGVFDSIFDQFANSALTDPRCGLQLDENLVARKARKPVLQSSCAVDRMIRWLERSIAQAGEATFGVPTVGGCLVASARILGFSMEGFAIEVFTANGAINIDMAQVDIIETSEAIEWRDSLGMLVFFVEPFS